MSSRDRILGRVRGALDGRDAEEYPGPFLGWRSGPPSDDPVGHFEAMFEAAGGEVVRTADLASAAEWIAAFSMSYASVATGQSVPPEVRPDLDEETPAHAPLGLSMASGAIGETGSLMLDARDGRRAQLLAPTHVVVVRLEDIHATLLDALQEARIDLPSALGLHSGPSKSADIGQILVKGVHGPGRLVAVVVGVSREPSTRVKREDEAKS